jgi:broad specificity phosphatase PhoE
MTNVILVRHGETQWNRELIFRGRADIPLSAKGLAQAEQLAAALTAEKIDAVYASPLARAQQTAQPLATPRSLEVETSDYLLDMNFGEWEGLSVEAVEDRYPELFQLWQHHPELCVPPGGESLAEIRDRIKSGLQAWLAHRSGQTIALVTHRVVCKVMLCEVLGLDNSAFWRIQQDVCALNRFRREEQGYILLKMNDTGHLTARPGAGLPDF